MDIHRALLEVHSKNQAMKITDYVGDDEKRFAELADIFFSGDYRTMQCAAWPINHCVERNPGLIFPYLDKFVDMLGRKDVHNAVRRNIARMLQYVEVPKRLQGKLYSVCLDRVEDTEEPIAVRVFALTVAVQIARDEPDLLAEIRLIVDKHLPHSTAAFRSRARRILCI